MIFLFTRLSLFYFSFILEGASELRPYLSLFFAKQDLRTHATMKSVNEGIVTNILLETAM
jgi:hypothetical protein